MLSEIEIGSERCRQLGRISTACSSGFIAFEIHRIISDFYSMMIGCKTVFFFWNELVANVGD